ncbi:MAG TPA: Na+/H+ antiporter NhaA [Longimicrobiales bacterium]|nr:Na+/H+ antiporter NhaA [Longimicrobiales bacterium]
MTILLLRPIERFLGLESASGILLLLSAAIALVWANSPWSASYFDLWHLPIVVGAGGYQLSLDLHHWINDGLMAVFFFVVGLEIKREVLVGELASPRAAALSIFAAIGGMVVPAAIYVALNAGGPGEPGWGIPMATDIAFALGVLILLGRRIPLALKVFVTAVAIVDDLGAVAVIALFYTSDLALGSLGWAALLLLLSVGLNRMGVRRTLPYAVLGGALWLALLTSGVHATVAGVLLAMTIPARRLIDAPQFLERAGGLLAEFAEDVQPGRMDPTPDQRDALLGLEDHAERLSSPLLRLEHALHPLVAFVVMPLFALANAGVALGAGQTVAGAGAISLGVLLGLVLGKPIGIVLASWLAVRGGIAILPAGIHWGHMAGAGILCGIGFTMSLFIANLAFPAGVLLPAAKIGILAGSAIAGVAGTLVLLRASRRVPPVTDPEP